MIQKRTVVIGASENPDRYSYKAVRSLQSKGFEVFPVGIREGKIGNIPIVTDHVLYPDIDTITLYVGPRNQPFWYEYILALKPKRIIFNPGTEDDELEKICLLNDIEVEIACTLVMLSIGIY